ncbi:conserved exported hypothetical protein [Nocardioides sp. AX2bis]|nr:conserved exported hypothetical protein [Nocardioides sp. AX2bis]
MRRSRILMATTALSMSFLVGGCGGGTDAYCEDLRSAEEQFTAFDEGTPDAQQFEDAISTFRSLGEEAPDEVAQEWEVFLGAFDDLEKALEDAGIEFGDLADIQAGELPEGLDEQALQDLGTEIESLGGDEIEQASDAIEEHASSECDVDLSGS